MNKNFCCVMVEKSWSGNLTPPRPYDQMKNTSRTKAKKGRHRRLNSTGGVGFEGDGISTEPRLVRSSGMRRDWSFENLRQRDQKKGRIY